MPAPRRLPFSLACGLAAAGLVLGAMGVGGALAQQAGVPPATPPVAAPAPALVPPPASLAQAQPPAQANKPSVSTRAPIRPAQVRNAPAPRPESSPTWAELTAQQQA